METQAQSNPKSDDPGFSPLTRTRAFTRTVAKTPLPIGVEYV
jgi:hypothetical protein